MSPILTMFISAAIVLAGAFVHCLFRGIFIIQGLAESLAMSKHHFEEYVMVLLPSLVFFVIYAFRLSVSQMKDFMLSRLFAIEKRELQREEEKTEYLLYNVLPKSIVQRLKQGEEIADTHESCSVVFADIVDFERIAKEFPAQQLVIFLNELFSKFSLILLSHLHFVRFDDVLSLHNLNKVKTTGSVIFFLK